MNPSSRQRLRLERPTLQPGRPVLPPTTLNRRKLFQVFADWFFEDGIVQFGRLYSARRPYIWALYPEAIDSLVPERKQCYAGTFKWCGITPLLGSKARLRFITWSVFADPFAIFAIVSNFIDLGWVREARTLALTWGGLLQWLKHLAVAKPMAS